MTRRVLVISSVRGDTRRYRALHLIEQLELLGVTCTFVHLADLSVDSHVRQLWDLVIFHRLPYSDHVRSIFETLRSRNTIILSDFDDLVFDLAMFDFINSPDFSDPIRAAVYKKTMQRIYQTLDESEGATASTNFLAEQIRKQGKPVWIHRNAFSLEMLAVAQSHFAARLPGMSSVHGDRVVVGYASGTPTHNRDFDLITPALQKLMDQYVQLDLWLIGPLDLSSEWNRFHDRIRRFPLVPWRKLPAMLAQFDINLAPLLMNNPFAQSKSEIKFMEAAMVGVPTVASSTDAFCYAIRSGENGFLASSEEEWVTHLAALIEDPRLCKAVGEQAHADVMKQYHPATRASQLADRLEEISLQTRAVSFWGSNWPEQAAIERRAGQRASRKQWLRPGYEKDPSNIQLGIYSLKHAGLKATLKHAWVFFRRFVSPLFPFKQRSGS